MEERWATDWDLLDPREVGRHLKVSPTTIRVWCIRGLMPEPDVIRAGTPVWTRHTITAWAQRRGLIPLLRAQVVQLLQRRGNGVHIRDLIEHWVARGGPAIEPQRAVRALLLDLIDEGYVVRSGRDTYRSLPALDVGSFDDRCLGVAHALRGFGALDARDVAAAMGLHRRERERVARALLRLRDAGLLFPAPSNGRYQGVTPAGWEWHEAWARGGRWWEAASLTGFGVSAPHGDAAASGSTALAVGGKVW